MYWFFFPIMQSLLPITFINNIFLNAFYISQWFVPFFQGTFSAFSSDWIRSVSSCNTKWILNLAKCIFLKLYLRFRDLSIITIYGALPHQKCLSSTETATNYFLKGDGFFPMHLLGALTQRGLYLTNSYRKERVIPMTCKVI